MEIKGFGGRERDKNVILTNKKGYPCFNSVVFQFKHQLRIQWVCHLFKIYSLYAAHYSAHNGKFKTESTPPNWVTPGWRQGMYLNNSSVRQPGRHWSQRCVQMLGITEGKRHVRAGSLGIPACLQSTEQRQCPACPSGCGHSCRSPDTTLAQLPA